MDAAGGGDEAGQGLAGTAASDAGSAGASGSAQGSAYTPGTMDTGTLGERRQGGFDALYAEAKEALSHSANQLRALTERVRETYAQGHADWQRQRADPEPRGAAGHAESDSRSSATPRPTTGRLATADAPPRLVDPARDLARGKQMLARLELAVQGLEETWRFLERGQGHLTGDESGRDAGAGPAPGDGASMRILEAQEGERARLAAELHDGPAQALANAVFQVEIVDRSLVTDREAARREVRALRALLERELDDVRGYINQLRPALDEPRALDAALRDAADDLRATTAASVEVRLDGGADGLDPVARSVVLRVAQEALRNVRKHADARHVWLTTAVRPGSDGARWVLEVRDDGRGFDTQEASTRTNRRHFGLRFMRERAALIGAGLDVEASVATGTTVRLTIERG